MDSEGLFNRIQQLISYSPALDVKIILTLLILFLLWLDRKITLHFVQKRFEDVRMRYQIRKTIEYVSAFVAIILLGWVWFDGIESLGTFLGLVSAGLVIALKDLMADLAGWLFITWRKPFTEGDRIQIGDYSGDVIDIRAFQFTILEIGNWVDADQSTGRIIHMPNGMVFNQPQASYTQGFHYIWHEIPVIITFESDWRTAKQHLLDIINRHAAHVSDAAQEKVKQAAQKYFIVYSKLTPTVYTSVNDYGIVLTIRYLTEPRRRRGSEQGIWEEILDMVSANPNISFAYPTQRFYSTAKERSCPFDDATTR